MNRYPKDLNVDTTDISMYTDFIRKRNLTMFKNILRMI